MSKQIVIVGWPGVGKSQLAKNVKGWVDLDLAGAPMQVLLEKVNHALEKGQKVLLPSYLKVRDALSEAGIEYTLVVPARDLKFDYLSRLIKRGAKGEVVFAVDKHWDVWMDSCLGEPTFNTLVMQRSGDYLQDYVEMIESKYAE